MLAYICFAGLKKIHNLRLCQPNGFIFQPHFQLDRFIRLV